MSHAALLLRSFGVHRLRSVSVFSLMVVAAVPASAEEIRRSEAMMAHDGYFREHCLNLQSGQTLEFRFATPHPVDFNIHHHSDTDTHYPLRQPVERELSSSLAIADSGQHCFMWKNLGDYPADYTIDLIYQVR